VVAGEEERGTLDLLLSAPLPRWRVVVEKGAALVVATMGLALALWLALSVGAAIVGMDVDPRNTGGAALSVALLGLTFGALALTLASAGGGRGSSVGVAAALGVAAYFLNALTPVVRALEPLRRLSPFYYYIGADPLRNGLNPAHAAVLAGLVVALVAAAATAFERRDIGV